MTGAAVNGGAVHLAPDHLAEIEAAAEAAYPEEACGLLIGASDPARGHWVNAIAPSKNVARPPRTRRFEVDPVLRIELERRLRDAPEAVIGVYHSHPDGPAVPSETDTKMIFDLALVWLITAVADGIATETTAHVPKPDRSGFAPVALYIKDAP